MGYLPPVAGEENVQDHDENCTATSESFNFFPLFWAKLTWLFVATWKKQFSCSGKVTPFCVMGNQ